MKKSILLTGCLLLILSPAMLATETDLPDPHAGGPVVSDDSALGGEGVAMELGIEKRGLQPRLGIRNGDHREDGHEHGQGHGPGHEHGNGLGPGHSHGNDEGGDDEDDDEDGDETPISN